MALTIGDRKHVRQQEPREESYIHFLARESQWILRIIVILSVAATILLMFTIFYLAFVPALILLAAYCLLLIADYIEYRTHQPGDPGWEGELSAAEMAERAAVEAEIEAAQDPIQKGVNDAVKARLTKTIIGIIASIALVAATVAGIFLDRQIIALGAMILFAYWLFIAAPLWLGWLEDEAEEEAHRAEAELHEQQKA